jgi:uroporphyrinogen decarboxylase
MSVTLSEMTARERVGAALAGEPVDRPPVALWRHFPEEDQTAEGLAAATLRWQQAHGFDLIKLMPPGDYPTIDWGAVSVYQGATGGTRQTTRFPVTRPADWTTLPPLDVRQGFNGVMLDAVAQTRAALDPAVILLQTVFSSLTVANKLTGGLAVEHLRAHPTELRAGLRRITEVTRDVAAASLAAGADGLFFATQLADFTVLDETEYREFGLAYDLQVLEAAGESRLTMLHLHGEAPMFELQSRYPIHAVNWHDRRAAPHLAEGRVRAGRCVAGGLDERRIATYAPEQAAAEAREAIAQTGGAGLIVAPGCVIPITTAPATIQAAVDAVKAAGAG